MYTSENAYYCCFCVSFRYPALNNTNQNLSQKKNEYYNRTISDCFLHLVHSIPIDTEDGLRLMGEGHEHTWYAGEILPIERQV